MQKAVPKTCVTRPSLSQTHVFQFNTDDIVCKFEPRIVEFLPYPENSKPLAINYTSAIPAPGHKEPFYRMSNAFDTKTMTREENVYMMILVVPGEIFVAHIMQPVICLRCHTYLRACQLPEHCCFTNVYHCEKWETDLLDYESIFE